MKHLFSVDFHTERTAEPRTRWLILAVGAAAVSLAVHGLDGMRKEQASVIERANLPNLTQSVVTESGGGPSDRVVLGFIDYPWKEVTDSWESLSSLDTVITSVTHDVRSGATSAIVLLPSSGGASRTRSIEGLQRAGWSVRSVNVLDNKSLRVELNRPLPATR